VKKIKEKKVVSVKKGKGKKREKGVKKVCVMRGRESEEKGEKN
jgi:hypothetical protein